MSSVCFLLQFYLHVPCDFRSARSTDRKGSGQDTVTWPILRNRRAVRSYSTNWLTLQNFSAAVLKFAPINSSHRQEKQQTFDKRKRHWWRKAYQYAGHFARYVQAGKPIYKSDLMRMTIQPKWRILAQFSVISLIQIHWDIMHPCHCAHPMNPFKITIIVPVVDSKLQGSKHFWRIFSRCD